MKLGKTIKYYLNDERTWGLEGNSVGEEIWLRTEKGSYHPLDLETLKMLHLAAGELIKEIEEEKTHE